MAIDLPSSPSVLRKNSEVFGSVFDANELPGGFVTCLLCKAKNVDTSIQYRFNKGITRTEKMKAHIREFHPQVSMSKTVSISRKDSPFMNNYNTAMSLQDALKMARYRLPLGYHESNAIAFNTSSITREKVRESLISHATRIQRNIIALLRGNVTLAVDGVKLMNGETVYAVTALKNGKSYYLASFNKKEANTGAYLATELTALINELKDNDVEVVAIVTDNGSNLVKAAKLLSVPRVACICHVLNLIIKDILPEKRLRAALQEFREAANRDNESYDIPEYCVIRWFTTVKVVSYLLSHKSFISCSEYSKFLELLPALSYMQAVIGALENDTATLIDAWHYLIRILPRFGHIQEVNDAYSKHFAKKLNYLHVLYVMIYLTPTYDLDSDLSMYCPSYRDEFSFESMAAKINALAEYWGVTIKKVWLEEYHENIGAFRTKPEKTAGIIDSYGNKIAHEAVSHDYFDNIKDRNISYNFRIFYSILCDISTSEASVERIFSSLNRSVCSGGFNSKYDLVQSRMVLNVGFDELTSEVQNYPRNFDVECLYEDCYVCQPSAADNFEGTSLRTPLNSVYAETRDYYAEAKKVIDELIQKISGSKGTTQIISQEDFEDESDYYEVEDSE